MSIFHLHDSVFPLFFLSRSFQIIFLAVFSLAISDYSRFSQSSYIKRFGVPIYFTPSVCYFTSILSFDQKMISHGLLLRLILHPVYCLQNFCQLVYDQCGYWFCHPGISKFVCEILYVCSSLKILPFFFFATAEITCLYPSLFVFKCRLCLRISPLLS